jgi:DNA invertase Pin-like site-specific DNA recombinase
VKTRVIGVRIPKENHPQIIQMYEAGQSCHEIAKEFGCSHNNIYCILQIHDVKMRPTSMPDEYSGEICQKMVDLYKQGHTQKSIATQFGCANTVVKRILDEHDIKCRPRYHFQSQSHYAEPDHQRMVSMYEQGKSQREIAREIGCTHSTVNRVLKSQGIKIRSRLSYHTIPLH